jgi:geranylgeranyl transferase type-1 subunit beta
VCASQLYFVVHALDILGALSRLNRASIIEYVYSLQIEPSTSAGSLNTGLHVVALSVLTDVPLSHCGFIGGGFLGHRFGSVSDTHTVRSLPVVYVQSPYMHALCQSHLAMTYTALAILTTLGDDLSRVNKEAVVQAIRTLQQADGR